MPGASQTRAYVALLVMAMLWGSYPVTAKLALRDIPPIMLAAIRCTVASTFLIALLLRARPETLRGLTPATLRDFLLLGAFGIWGSTQVSYLAIYYTTASNAVILQAATPVIVGLGAWLYLGERLARRQWAGVVLSGFGVLLVITDGRLAALRPEELRAGDFINLIGLCGWSAYTLYGKKVLTRTSPALATTGAYVMGTLLIIVTSIVTAPLFPKPRLSSVTAWTVILYQGLVGAVAHVWWYRAVSVVGPSRSAVFMNFQPVVGVVLATTLLKEGLTGWDVAGGALVLVGVALTTREKKTPVADRANGEARRGPSRPPPT
ncbi:MAG: hypothetical protein AUI04_09845 [Candidatus Rokubacteria bacterium 13_2_20CM_2_64_8]|nr:MAG: hypothetical protein AUH18_03330 [Candidatus Rokubacteria bacterium 13_2_20CM_69_10]OLB40507.1 MAG: hypothetical protein AUI04_09845 [Candidatus Rokubacteria bacterium 13_2_20CM_2_64_8]OLC63637.1 MAG: hypothetical protein AUH76_05935 [Candidatus Rokubacteria bacterium 13_1_40CM_4_67_11]PYN61241.1 MAG: hypothetical protein DMD90_23965 [Candidatus Rokubacteria bacterium]